MQQHSLITNIDELDLI